MRTHVGNWLKALPDVAPPGGLAERVHAAQRAELARRRRRWLRDAGGLALAAGVVMVVALTLLQRPDETASAGHELEALQVQSRALEELLWQVDTGAGVLDLGTADAIVQLEDRIATVDRGLRFAALEQEDRTRLWQQRVNLMQALVDVHLANEF